jgi:ComF family protein
MKRPTGEGLAIAVAHLLADHTGSQLVEFEPDVVVPIPMHWTRRLVRGTNSAETLAEVLARRGRLPIARRLLVRLRKTLPQFNLHPGERVRNIRGAFRVRAGYHLDAARVLLVDDILTTGATCSEASRVLLAAGAAQTTVAVVARAEGE